MSALEEYLLNRPAIVCDPEHETRDLAALAEADETEKQLRLDWQKRQAQYEHEYELEHNAHAYTLKKLAQAEATIRRLIQERNKAIDELTATNIELEGTVERLQSLVAVEQGSSMAAAIWKQRAEQAEGGEVNRPVCVLDENGAQKWLTGGQAEDLIEELQAELAVKERMLKAAYEYGGFGGLYAAEYDDYLADLRARAEKEDT